ncbi:nose resistant to fluoxetine protein 6 [Tribolium castaneum]|uniref:Nose resistant to fluoxetine protein 6-like Protein n=1 Tax=Tribolium castaneum TaxID=7070 RepID=D2A530_TRICA|nr:PREDICTED: nose resistant to fluoxetine protein 6 [Tribolium castaneum]EFA05306.2 Nose resistant to fluoxetine protein 6-like Protein [Tribolium castaneum]|eukprot:XP_015838129.1 PREDICTED: nose resistant to fluoxetine protein 6 [Tribolium castaneum]
MNKTIFLFLLAYATATKLLEMEYKEGTKVDPKYSLPQVNLSASDGNHTVVPASLARVLNFFNSEILAANWETTKKLVSLSCRKDVELYLEGLRKTENWALKMDDASGRYSTGWFWGNQYWTGSQSLCENIVPRSKSIVVNPENRTRTSREAEVPRRPSSPSQSVGYVTGPLKFSSLPPFPISFFMLRIDVNSSFTTEERILHIGLCMPYVCTDSDIKVIMEETSKASTKVTVKVEAVRSHHNRFNIWQDRTFIILCGVTSFVVVCLIIGTSYDFYLEHEEKRKKLMSISQTHLKLDMSMPDTKTKNGVYTVNNNNEETEAGLKTEAKPRTLRDIVKLIVKETVLAFSLRANIRTICDQSVSSDTIPVIHGLKSISMAWVILGHTCIIAFKYSDNMEYRKVVQREFFFQTISNGAFSVDTFFFTSGLLVSFLYFRTNAKGKLAPITIGHNGFISGITHFFGLILYRFARLTAPYLFTLGVVEVIMKWFNYNSIFEPPTMDHVNCPNYWWRNVLYINTLFPVEEMCMLWSWYLSDDTQFYIVGAVMLILAASHFKSGACLLLIFMVSSWITTGYIAYSNSHMPGSDDPLALFDKIYDKPWTRLGPYLIGMCVGWFLFKKNCQLTMSKLAVVSGWTAAIACLLSLVYGLYEANLSPLAGAAYSALSHSAWALGLAWIVVACSTGYGGFANSVLSSTILYPFSRITYCAYLLHPVVIRVMTMSMDSPLHLGSLVMIIIFLGQVVASYVLSFFVSLAFEAPVVSMLRIMTKVVGTKK